MGDMQMSLSKHILCLYDLFKMVIDVAFCVAHFCKQRPGLTHESVQAILSLTNYLFS